MATIESNKVNVNANPSEVFNYLMDLNNLYDLLPQDKISDWTATNDACSFKVAGGYKIGLKHKSATEPNNIILESTDVSPFAFDLDIKLEDADSATNAHMVSNADLNPFMKMMVEKPLKNLFDYIAKKLSDKFA